MTSAAFDTLAASYDRRFTHTRLGRWLREAVWDWLGAAFLPGQLVLELGCGTGEDAVWLARRGVRVVATDASPAMLALARRKAAAAHVAQQVAFAQLDLSDRELDPQLLAGAHALSTRETPGWREHDWLATAAPGLFDGAFSNFGPLNCLADRRGLADALARALRPGGRLLLVVMGPLCLWELAWHLAHGQPRQALRRLLPGTAARLGGASLPVWYPAPRRLRAEFEPAFRHLKTAGLGTLLPPSYLGHLVERWPATFQTLALLDRWLAAAFPWSQLGDHYLILFERR